MKYTIFNTRMGFCGLVGQEEKLRGVIPFLKTEEEVESLILSMYSKIIADTSCFRKIEADIQRYFSGEKVCFQYPLDFSHHTQFQRKVWEITGSIPYGEIRTYGWVSKKMGNPRSSRAVGNALAQNPFPIVVPCHRVMRGDGGFGGYSAQGGIHLKARLLQGEGCAFDSKGRITGIFQ